jgi:hypothetical protein
MPFYRPSLAILDKEMHHCKVFSLQGAAWFAQQLVYSLPGCCMVPKGVSHNGIETLAVFCLLHHRYGIWHELGTRAIAMNAT